MRSNEISNILDQISKISAINSEIIQTLSIQLSKIATDNLDTIENFITQLTKVFQNFPKNNKVILDSLSDGQLLSKRWLVEHVKELNLGNIFLCGGWYAILLLDNRLKFTRCINIDIDPTCEEISKIIHKKFVIDNWKFQAITENIHNINYEEFNFRVKRNDKTDCELTIKPDTIINTSCEHIENFSNWWNLLPKGKLIIVQSNNGFGLDGHTNCVKNLNSFKKQTPLSQVIYSGEKEMPKFTRFMRIGYK